MENLTEAGLQQLWDNLDNASGSLYKAFDVIQGTENFPKGIVENSEKIDISEIDNLKQKVEELIENKKKK